MSSSPRRNPPGHPPQHPPQRVSVHASAPAKINLGLFVGPVREEDARHELASVMQSISLADELTLESVQDAESGAGVGVGEDEIVCPGVPGAPGENLAASALGMFRQETGWDARPLRLSIAKRIPVAAGLGGGSADAAAALRLAHHASGLGTEDSLLALAARLGADVPAQIVPGRWLATGAGERLGELPPPSHPFGVLVLPAAAGLSTAEVYARADRLGSGRTREELRDIARSLRSAFELSAAAPADRELLHNDLEAAAVSLCPEIELALAQALEAGADAAFVSGSGPTVVGLFLRANGPGRAERAAAGLASDRRSAGDPAPIWATPADRTFARVWSP